MRDLNSFYLYKTNIQLKEIGTGRVFLPVVIKIYTRCEWSIQSEIVYIINTIKFNVHFLLDRI